MNRSVRTPLVVTLVLLTSSIALAQGLPSGSITGSVTTAADGQPLLGVTVTVRSPALQGMRQAVSTANGDFLLTNLPPGEYEIELQLQGFRTVTRAGLRVATAQRQELAVAMGLEAFSDELVVTASSELVSTSPQAATSLSAAAIDLLPISRTIESVALLAPGVNSNGPNRAITISGGESYENSFNINGIQAQDSWLATPEPVYIGDAVAEMTTLTSGISAEYGRFSGGIVNVLTKSGGNTFSGSLRATLVNDAWSSPTPMGEEREDDVTPVWEITLGGPIWRDRLWFFAAGRLFDQTTTGRTASPTDIDFPMTEDEKRYELKLTASPTPGHTLTASFLQLEKEERGMDQGMPILDLTSRDDRDTDQSMLLASYTGTLSSSIFGEASYARRRVTISGSGSKYIDLERGTPIISQVPLAAYNSPFGCAACPDPDDQRSSDQWVAKATAFVSTRSSGSHTIVGGVELFESSWVWNQYQSGSDYQVDSTEALYEDGELYPVFGPGTSLWVTPVLVPSTPDDAKTWAAYANDVWSLSDRLTFNLGLRWDQNDVRDASGALQSDEGTLSPRLGVVWDPTGASRVRLTASWSRYVSTVNEWQLGWASQPGQPAVFAYLYEGPAINADPGGPRVGTAEALRQMFEWFGITAPGQFPRAGIDPFLVWFFGVSQQMRGELKPQHSDEVSLGVNGRLGTEASFRVDGVYRAYSDFYGYVCDLSTGQVEDPMGNTWDLKLLTSVNEPLERSYLALKTAVEARLAPTFALSGAWTWSRTSGNQTSETTGNGGIPQDVFTYPEYRDLAWNAPVGDLRQDVRHRVRVWATWDMTFIPRALGRFTLSPLFSLDTGQPYGVVGPILVQPYVTNPGYVTPPYEVDYYFTARDAYRTPTVTSLDLGVRWGLDLRAAEVFVDAHILNVFDEHDIATSDPYFVDLSVRTAANSPDLQPFDPFIETPVEDVHFAKSATFGQALVPTAYQQPRTFLISMGVLF